MNHSEQPINKSQEQRKNESIESVTQRASTMASKFFKMAEKTRAEEEKHQQGERSDWKEKMFTDSARAIGEENFSGAQSILESKIPRWNDTSRGAASEINKLDQEKNGETPISFNEALKAMSRYSSGFEKMSKEPGGSKQDLKSAIDIGSITNSASRPGIEGIDVALEYIEGTLKSKSHIADSILKSKVLNKEKTEFLKDLKEKRAIRDALFQEKQKRAGREKLDTADRRSKENDQQKIEEVRKRIGLEGAGWREVLESEKATSRSPVQEMPRQERRQAQSKEEDPLEKLFKSAETPRNSTGQGYTPEKGSAAIVDVLKRLYPDSKQFITRVEALVRDFNSAKEESKYKNPNRDEFTQDVIGTKSFINNLPQSERQAIERFLDESREKLGSLSKESGFGMRFSPEKVIPDFIKFIERLKNKR